MLTKASRHPGGRALTHEGVEVSMRRGFSSLTPHPSPLFRRGFTLTELMIAVAVLLVVIIGTSKIFSTASQVTGIGQATASVMQEAAAIERQLRADLANLNYDGIFAIRCVKVRNDINLPGGGLLNPNLPPDASIRADQLLFFTQGVQSMHTYRLALGSNHKAQGLASRIYYGHAFQLPLGGPYQAESAVRGRAIDPLYDPSHPIFPWHLGEVDMQRTLFKQVGNTGSDNDIYKWITAPPIDGTQPPATEWLLARQDVALVDDDNTDPDRNSKTVYMGYNQTARSIFLLDPRVVPGFASYEILNGRMDGAASRMNDIRYALTRFPSTGKARPWNDGSNTDQRSMIAQNLLYYPRAERIAPSMHRVDQALTNPVIGSACSSFTVEWTYEDRVGTVVCGDGTIWRGMEIEPDREQPWFGLTDPMRGVFPYTAGVWWNVWEETIFASNLEEYDAPGTQPVELYEAFFGYNQTNPVDANCQPDVDLGYTPWPSAIRITMTLHDPESKLPNGKVFQFVMNLPKRVDDVIPW